jgi:hypothetical protein
MTTASDLFYAALGRNFEGEDTIVAPICKPALTACACGRIQQQLHFPDGSMVFTTQVWDNKAEAASDLVDRIFDAGIELTRTH